MTYQETLAYLYASQPAFHIIGGAAYKPGLDNIIRLLDGLGNPHKQIRTIHIAGTNGKGSTSHLIAAVLQESGYKTGLFTSPHLVDFSERIRINGQAISETDVINFVEMHKDLLETIKPSFFENSFAMAMDYFAHQQVDVAVIEVGLGGRLDSTNVIEPDLCVITNIGFDHTEFLGNTLPLIAGEKAGIIKPNTPVVIGETQTECAPIFLQKAHETNSDITFADQQDSPNWDSYSCELNGEYQSHNKQTAYVAIGKLREVGYKISDNAIRAGCAHVCTLTGLKGRWQTLSTHPMTICDTGHNAHGLQYVGKQLSKYPCKELHIVFGMVKDKDVNQALCMMPQKAHYYFTQASTPRALPAEELQMLAQKHGLQGNAYSSIKDAYANAKSNAGNNDLIFIGGSNYVVGEALATIQFS